MNCNLIRVSRINQLVRSDTTSKIADRSLELAITLRVRTRDGVLRTYIILANAPSKKDLY